MKNVLARYWWSAATFLEARSAARLPWRTAAQWQERQALRVRSMVRHAYATVPHYREAMQAQGLTPADFSTAGSLRQLPLVSGAELASDPGRFYSSSYGTNDTLTLHSSGTGGRPKAVRYDRGALFEALAHGQRQRAVLTAFTGRPSGYRELAILRQESVATQMRRFYEERLWVPRRLDLQRSVVPMELPFDELLRRIDAFRPDVLLGYGAHLGALLRWAWQQGREFHRPAVAWYGADAMPPADRELVERELGIPVLSTYQADEALRIAFQCERRAGFHLHVDDVAVRVLTADGREAGPGERGEIVISNLANRATVLLNYRLGDIVRLSPDACDCGRMLPTLESIEGRADDLLTLPGGESRHALSFIAPIQAVPGVVQAQLVQESSGELSVRLVCAGGSDWSAIESAVMERVRDRVGPDMVVEVRRVERIPLEPGGKTRALINRLDSRNA